MDQGRAPLFEALAKHVEKRPTSFHVPGHKNGQVFQNEAKNTFSNILPYDLTELPKLDDLHQPEGAILEAEQLAAQLYETDYTFFLVNGSTVGNLAMILSVCQQGDTIIVQRNSHKSVMNGLELAGVKPVFVSPSYDDWTKRYSNLDSELVIKAIKEYPQAKAVFLSHPDYYGTTCDLAQIIKVAHDFHMPVLVDEAHGAHFPLSKKFPDSALELGADLVVHSAHKTLPAMTMGSFLHTQSNYVSYETVKHFLQMLQSSSPSYPIMASLDLARKFVASLTEQDVDAILDNVEQLRGRLNELPHIEVLPIKRGIDDPLKITLISDKLDMQQVEKLMHYHNVFPEMIQNNQLLLIAGLQSDLQPLNWISSLKVSLAEAEIDIKHDTITTNDMNIEPIQYFDYGYQEIKGMPVEWVNWSQSVDKIAASSVIPYPPGIPVLLKGERIKHQHIQTIQKAINNGQYIQYNGKQFKQGIEIYME